LGSIIAGKPRVMQRSKASRSVTQSNTVCPSFQLDLPASCSACACGVSGGRRPSAGLTISELRRPVLDDRNQSASPTVPEFSSSFA
jgi:hypothetical protein